MADTRDEERRKELARSAVVGALNQRRDWITKPATAPSKSRTLRNIIIWLLILAAAVGLYALAKARA